MTEQDGTVADEAARRRILTDLSSSFLVEAGAGSGKTTSLVGRCLALIESGAAEAARMAAITFTNKAADELRSRLRLQLEERLRRCGDDTVRARLAAALRQLPEGFIGTIHAFCGRLLRERPMEAGLDPEFRELTEEESRDLLNAHWDEYLMELRENDPDAFEPLAAFGVNVEDLRAVFLCIAMYDDVEIFTAETVRPDFAALRRSLLSLIAECARDLPSRRPAAGWDPLQQTIRSAQSFLRSRGAEDDMSLLALAAMFDRPLQVTQKRWPDPQAGKMWRERFADWRVGELAPFLQAWREYLHPRLVRFVRPAVEWARRRRTADGVLTFQDLLLKAAQLLREHAEARRYFAARYERLFVDEFQDTDPVQAEVMMLLAGADPGESDWRRQRVRPGSLFIVGDPKQSIYRFRRADITTYNFVKRRMEESGGEVLRLTRNFRSVRAIGDFVNYAFESKFLPPGHPGDAQAMFVRMLSARPNPAGRGVPYGVMTLTADKAEYDRKADIAAEDADRIARWIAWACDGHVRIAEERAEGKGRTRPARPDDFMILLKYREFIALYAERLEAYGVPADTSGSQASYEELHALRMLVRLLADPDDRVALLAVLRGPLFGVSDEALYLYTVKKGWLSLSAGAGETDELPEAAMPAEKALAALREWLFWTRTEPALSALLRIVTRAGLIPGAALQPPGSLRAGTLVKLLERLAADSRAQADWEALAERLENAMETGGLEGASLFAGAGRAVRIMNLHKAKGLEAPIVFLACPCGDFDPDATEHIDRMREPAAGYFAITRRKEYRTEVIAQPAGWPEAAAKERRYMNAERDRLLYVAATRAKQLTVVSRYPYKPAIDPWSGLAPALDGQPELEDVRRGEREIEAAGPLDLERSLRPWREAHARAAVPSFAVRSVTDMSAAGKEGVPLRLRPVDGKGAAFGTAVHRVLQAAGEGLSGGTLDAFAESAAKDAGLSGALPEDVRRTAAAVMSGSVWRRAMLADRRCHEFAFTFSESSNGVDTLVSGVIDLVFREADGWVIVDFKTDAMDIEDEAAFAAHYAPQVTAYARAWTALTGEPVKEAGLYFLHTGRYVPVPAAEDGGDWPAILRRKN